MERRQPLPSRSDQKRRILPPRRTLPAVARLCDQRTIRRVCHIGVCLRHHPRLEALPPSSHAAAPPENILAPPQLVEPSDHASTGKPKSDSPLPNLASSVPPHRRHP